MQLISRLSMASRLAALSGVLFLFTGPLSAAPYTIDPAKSSVVVQVFKEGVASGLAHDHVIKATQLSGKVEFDPTNASTAAISVEVKTSGLQVDAPALRKQYNLTSELSESDRKQVEDNMKSEAQLNVAKYPTLTFKSKSITFTGDKAQVTGDLTIRGVTRSVSFPATVKLDGSTFVGEGKLKVKQTDYGFEPYSALLGAIKNQNEVILNLKIVGNPS